MSLKLTDWLVGKLYGGCVESVTFDSNGMTFHDVVVYTNPQRYARHSLKRYDSLQEALDVLHSVVLPNIRKEA
jgi:hypothetical protein